MVNVAFSYPRSALLCFIHFVCEKQVTSDFKLLQFFKTFFTSDRTKQTGTEVERNQGTTLKIFSNFGFGFSRRREDKIKFPTEYNQSPETTKNPKHTATE